MAKVDNLTGDHDRNTITIKHSTCRKLKRTATGYHINHGGRVKAEGQKRNPSSQEPRLQTGVLAHLQTRLISTTVIQNIPTRIDSSLRLAMSKNSTETNTSSLAKMKFHILQSVLPNWLQKLEFTILDSTHNPAFPSKHVDTLPGQAHWRREVLRQWPQKRVLFMIKPVAGPGFLHLCPVTGQWMTVSRNKHLPSKSWKASEE